MDADWPPIPPPTPPPVPAAAAPVAVAAPAVAAAPLPVRKDNATPAADISATPPTIPHPIAKPVETPAVFSDVQFYEQPSKLRIFPSSHS